MNLEGDAIVATGLTKTFGPQRAVDDLSFRVPWNKVTGFLGPNGAGKSTTLRMVLGLSSADAGDSSIAGVPYAKLQEPARTVGALLETQQFHPLRSARDHLRVYAAAAGLPESRVDEVLALVELSGAARKKVGRFSLGMRQRLGLATALLGDPRILVLDEPANGLDPAGIRWLRRFLRSFASDGRAVFVSSHQLAEISMMADEVVVIDQGRLVVSGGVQELMARTEQRVRVRAEDPERLRDLLAAGGREAELIAHDTLIVRGRAEDIGRIAASAGVAVFELLQEEASLEDVFLELTGSEAIR